MARNLEIAKLFYTLEADSKGLEADLGKAEKSLGRTADFIKKNPVAAFGAFATAAVAAGLQVAKMAEETNLMLGTIRDRIPGATESFQDLRHVVNTLAITYGTSQEKILATMDAVSRGGVKTVAELESLTRAAVATGRATGTEFTTLVGGLDAALDIFGIGAQDATTAMAQFFAAAQGRTTIEDLLDTVQKLAPAIQGTGLDLLTTTRALATLIDNGFEPGKKVIAEFTERLRTGGVAAIQELAAQAPPAATAMDSFTAAIERNTTSIEANEARNRASVRATLVEIGSLLEPVGRLATDVLYKALGGGWRENRIRMEEAARQAQDTSGSLERLGVAGGVAAGAAGELTAALIQARGASAALGGESVAALTSYRQALQAVIGTDKEAAEDKATLVAVERELNRRREEGAATARKAAEDTARAAEEASRRYAEGMREIQDLLARSTITLVDDTQLAIDRLAERIKETGVAGEDAARALRPLNEQLALIKINERFNLPDILRKAAEAYTERDVAVLRQAEVQLRALAATATAGTHEQKAAKDQLKAVQDRILSAEIRGNLELALANDLQLDFVALSTAAGAQFDENGKLIVRTVEVTKDLGAEVAKVAQGAVGVAQGFGLINSEAASVLLQVVSIGENLGKALGGDTASIFAVLGGLTGVIDSLFSGNSAEDRARKELIRKNTQVIADLVRVNGNLLRVNSPGFRLAGARDALAGLDPALLRALDQGSGLDRALAARELGPTFVKALADQGLTIGDLDTIAKDLGTGITIRDKDGRLSGAGLLQLLDALRSGQFTKFADEIQEQFDRIRGMIEIGLIDPADELAEVVKVLSRPEVGKGVPAIAEAFKDLDLTTAGGKAEGIKRVQALFDSLNTGSLGVEQLGGLTGTEFRDVLLRLFGLLGGKPIEAAPPGTTESDPPGDTTGGGLGGGGGAAGGSLVGGATATFDDLFGVSVAARDFLASIDAQLKSPPISPIALPAGFSSGTVTGPGRGATVTFGDFHITVQVANTGASADEIGRASAEALDRLLYTRLVELRLARGDGAIP